MLFSFEFNHIQSLYLLLIHDVLLLLILLFLLMLPLPLDCFSHVMIKLYPFFSW